MYFRVGVDLTGVDKGRSSLRSTAVISVASPCLMSRGKAIDEGSTG